MNKLIKISILIGITFIKCMAFDPVASDEEGYKKAVKTHRIRQLCSIFEVVTKIKATDENIKGVLLGSTSQKNAVSFAVEIYAASSVDTPEEKCKNIIKCAQEHMDASDVLYKCAEALEPSKESVRLYDKILSNKGFSVTRRLLALRQLLQLSEVPQETSELIVMGFLSGYDEKLSLELYTQLKILIPNSKEAAKCIKQIDELLQEKDVLSNFHKQIEKINNN